MWLGLGLTDVSPSTSGQTLTLRYSQNTILGGAELDFDTMIELKTSRMRVWHWVEPLWSLMA